MQLAALLGTGTFVLVGAVVGVRLLLLARRTRQLPELYVGAALFCYAAVGQPFVAGNRMIAEAFGHEARLLAIGLGLLGNIVALLGVYLFTWTVYRRGSSLAGFVVWLAGVAALCSGVSVLATIPEAVGPMSDGTRLGIGALAINFGLGMAWAAAESLRYHLMMRRRLALGLADPVVVNRFLLWGAGCGAAALVCFSIIGCVAAGLNVAVHPVPLLLTSLAGTTTACCWYLTFLAPARYLRWVGDRATA